MSEQSETQTTRETDEQNAVEVNGVDLFELKKSVALGYTPTSATILDLIEMALGCREALTELVRIHDHPPIWDAHDEWKAWEAARKALDAGTQKP